MILPNIPNNKITPGFVRLGTLLNDSRVSRDNEEIDINDCKSGSFRISRNRQTRFSCL